MVNMETAQNLLQRQERLKIMSYEPRNMKVIQPECAKTKLISIACIQGARFMRD